MSRRGRAGAALLLGAVVLGGGGCAEISTSSPAGYQPATLESTGPDQPKKVTFTAEAAARVGLQTSTVRAAGDATAVDYAALVYDKQGKPWVFTVVAPMSPQGMSFLRASVTVDEIEGDRVRLIKGPVVGTSVVTRGAIEVWGAELGIAGKH